MFLSNAQPELYPSTSNSSSSAPILTSNASKYPRAVRALTHRYTKKAAKTGINMEWIDQKVAEDVEIVRREYVLTGKGEPSDELVIWFYEVEEYDRGLC